ncbi:19276_t:CDS:2 [Racocetra persica]|uniref:19276_t:CDS:1 n=1 Tax=Racocetra persica TaxID=160502 RepID=A0ACA9NJR7_9GLOM|nr:19276_t:CDS:2 [Racocetra persica]
MEEQSSVKEEETSAIEEISSLTENTTITSNKEKDNTLVTTPDPPSRDTPELSSQATELPIRSTRNTLIELDQNIHISQNVMQISQNDKRENQKQQKNKELEKLLTSNTFNNCTFNFG